MPSVHATHLVFHHLNSQYTHAARQNVLPSSGAAQSHASPSLAAPAAGLQASSPSKHQAAVADAPPPALQRQASPLRQLCSGAGRWLLTLERSACCEAEHVV